VTAAASMEISFAGVLTALRHSADHLAATVTPLTADQVRGHSYDDGWTIAQVASHLGSGAEVFDLFVGAGLRHEPAPGAEQFHPIWDTWNAKSAPDQIRDALAADATFLAHLDALTPGERERWQLDLFGTRQSLAGLLRMRLSEHAIHTWDIAVALDPSATVAADAVALIVDSLPGMAGHAGKGAPEPVSVHVTAAGPDREFLLELTPEHVRLAPAAGPGEAAASLRLPAEALVRLIYGRLDPGHTPASVEAAGVDLGTLRSSFPGF
jgi:uncharacterized protein (TIGR03083 family)